MRQERDPATLALTATLRSHFERMAHPARGCSPRSALITIFSRPHAAGEKKYHKFVCEREKDGKREIRHFLNFTDSACATGGKEVSLRPEHSRDGHQGDHPPTHNECLEASPVHSWMYTCGTQAEVRIAKRRPKLSDDHDEL